MGENMNFITRTNYLLLFSFGEIPQRHEMPWSLIDAERLAAAMLFGSDDGEKWRFSLSPSFAG